MALNSSTWNLVVKKKFIKSGTFKTLDQAVTDYLADGSRLPALKAAWKGWTKKFTDKGQTYKDSDRYAPGCALDDIAGLAAGGVATPSGNQSTLASQAVSLGGGGLRSVGPVRSHYTAPARNTGLTVQPLGWRYVAYDSTNANHRWAGAELGIARPLNQSKTARINEAFSRARSAVTIACDALAKLPRSASAWTAGGRSDDQTSYIDYFGAFDPDRFQQVTENFRILKMAFDRDPNVVDIRDTTSGGNCYAACVRSNLKTKTGGSLALTGRVDIFLGSAFLDDSGTLGQKYAKSTDSTVTTLVHEFAHGSFGAVDAPCVNGAGTGWTQPPSNLTPGHLDYGLSPDPWNNQASTEQADKALAAYAPDVAVRSADNYGQFARELLMRAKQ